MRAGRASGTAAYVALLRALGDRGLTSAEGFDDPMARALLPSRFWRALSVAALRLAALSPRARRRIVAHVDVLCLRALAIDGELSAAVAAGCAQVVILGAGLDDRAHRMSALAGAHVFEVDHPASQSVKRRRAADLPRRCRDLTYVSCDFVHDRLDARLASAGHRAGQATAWIWEGVTLYLTDDAIRDTLATIAARSSPNSRLVVEYHDADARARTTAFTAARRILLALWSEPQVGARSQTAMRAELIGAGLRVEKDFGVCDPRPGSARLAVATR